MAPFFALKYAPPAMAKTTPKGNYLNAAPKDQKYGSIIVVSSVASTYGGERDPSFPLVVWAHLIPRLVGSMFHNELACSTRRCQGWRRRVEG